MSLTACNQYNNMDIHPLNHIIKPNFSQAQGHLSTPVNSYELYKPLRTLGYGPIVLGGFNPPTNHQETF